MKNTILTSGVSGHPVFAVPALLCRLTSPSVTRSGSPNENILYSQGFITPWFNRRTNQLQRL